MNLLPFEIFLFCHKQTWFPPKMWWGTRNKDTKTVEKMRSCGFDSSTDHQSKLLKRSFFNNLCRRSVEYQNRILLESCGSIRNRINEIEIKICYFQGCLCRHRCKIYISPKWVNSNFDDNSDHQDVKFFGILLHLHVQILFWVKKFSCHTSGNSG